MARIRLKALHGDVYISSEDTFDRREKIYGGRAEDKLPEEIKLSEATKEVIRKIRGGETEVRMRTALNFLDALVLRAMRTTCIDSRDVRYSGTGFAVLNGFDEESDRRKLYIGYYLGCAAVEREAGSYEKLDYSMLWATSRGLAFSSIEPGKSSKITFIDVPFEKIDRGGLYILSEHGLDEDESANPLDIDSVLAEWTEKTSERRLPVLPIPFGEAKDAFSIGASLLSLQTLRAVYTRMGMRGIDLTLYGIYRGMAGRSEEEIDAKKEICGALLCPDDAAAIHYAARRGQDGPLGIFARAIDGDKAYAYGLDKDGVYTFEDFSLFIPTTSDLLTAILDGVFARDGAKFERACGGDCLSFDDSMEFAHVVYTAEASYRRLLYKRGKPGQDLPEWADPLKTAKAISAFPELRPMIGAIYAGMDHIDEGETYLNNNKERDEFYSKILESEKYKELTEEMERHRDRQSMRESLSFGGEEEPSFSLVEPSSPFWLPEALFGDISSVLNDKETVDRYLKEEFGGAPPDLNVCRNLRESERPSPLHQEGAI